MKEKPVTEDKWEREWIRGEKGGLYYINDLGHKVYKREKRGPQRQKPKRKFTPRRGSFYRHLQNQVDADGKNLDLC